jgi:hypothetical protein
METTPQGGANGGWAAGPMTGGLEVGGYEERPDWPKMGPSLLIATCLILAIRTAKRPPILDAGLSNSDIQEEIQFSSRLARLVLSALMSENEGIFPRRKQAWYQPDDEDVPK